MKKSNWEIMEGIIGKKKAKEVRRSLGGENTYVPKEGEEDDIKARNDKIYEKFLSGKSIKELAREYSMTTKWIRNILKSYGFFHELFADKEYQKIIKDALPHDIFALFNTK